MLRGKKGVDLSNWQAALASAAPLTDAGAEFAILKLSEGRGFADGSFSRFYDMCREAGIAVGAYVYSHSADADGGRAEAEYALHLLDGRELELPLYLDIEGDILSRGGTALTASARAFGERVSAAGYRPGVYASLYPLRELLGTEELKNEGFSVWCAAYNDSGPGIDCDIWQHSCSGRVPGYSGDVDMDIMINDVISRPPCAEPEEKRRFAADMSTLCRGFYGTQVEALQLLLGVEPGGVFDAATEEAVRSFQRLCGIAADGIAGPQTYSKLKETLK